MLFFGPHFLVLKNCKIFPFFNKVNLGYSTLTPKKKLPILFDNFFDVLWAAGGFGCMWVAFEFGFFNYLCFVGLKICTNF